MTFTDSAFPGALGWGRNSVGGSGRHLATPITTIYRVTNLSNSGAGSLRDACSATGPRTVIFETSGTIVLTSDIFIDNPYITIAGQTAPSPGVTFRGGEIKIRTNDVIIRHLRGRVGDDLNGNPNVNRQNFGCLGHNGKNVSDVIIANCSVSWSVDQAYGCWVWAGGSVEKVTFQDILAGEPLRNSIHSEGAAHPYGPIVGGGTASPEKVSFVRNLWVSHYERHPRIGKSTISAEVVNCCAFNWNNKQACNIKNDGIAVDLSLDFIGNAYIAGDNSDPATYAVRSGGVIQSGTELYVDGNICPQRPTDTGSEWDAVDPDIPEGTHKSVTRVADSGDGYTPIAPGDLKAYLVLNAGARPNDRDSVDTRIAGYADSETSVEPPDSPADVGGWPALAVNPVSHTIPENPNTEGDDGYTVLENWLEDFHLALQSSESTPPIPPPPIPDPNPTPGSGIPVETIDIDDFIASRFKVKQFVNKNGATVASVVIDTRTGLAVTDPAILALLKE